MHSKYTVDAQYLYSEDIKVLMNLKKNKDIACIQTQKTGKMIMLNKPDYIEMMKNTFRKMKIEIKNKTQIRRDKVNN